MCARYTLRQAPSDVARRFQAQPALFELSARYNIAPTQPVLVVHEQGARMVEPMRWGLVPSWSRDPEIGARLVNARAETIAEKPSFRTALKRRRCLIPADGFYEWTGSGKERNPMFIHRRDDALFAFAGLWEEWESPDGSPLHTCTIITTTPNRLIAPIHDRMPVILPREHENTWLDSRQFVPNLLRLLQPYAGNAFEAYPVSRHVNTAANEGSACIARQEGLF